MLNKKSFFLTIGLLILVNFVSASFPGIPHQFYGKAFSDGQLLQNGVITAEIGGETVGLTQIKNGQYGYNPIFLIADPDYKFNGRKITFYVNNVEAENYTFENGEVTKLDLHVGKINQTQGFCGNDILDIGEQCDLGGQNGVTCDNSTSSCTYCSLSCQLVTLPFTNSSNGNQSNTTGGTSGRSVSRGRELSYCEPEWECGSWSECYDGIQTRKCTDLNFCGTELKPTTSRACELDSIAEKPQNLFSKISGKAAGSSMQNQVTIVLLILITIMLGLVVVLSLRKS